MAPRKAVAQELTREAIIDAARGLFQEKGYQNLSMRQIAQTLQYSHGALYYHFKNKAELFYAIVKQDFSLLDDTLDQILSRQLEPSEKLRRVLLGFIEFGLTHRSHYEIMFLIRDKEIQEFVDDGPSHSYEKFAKAVQSLSKNRLGIQTIWSLFLALHGFVTHYCRNQQSYEEVRSMAEYHVEFLLKGLLHE
ncbi:TetR/AcrR family transcriptional regulator [Brevibacillus fulvus]|uniref:AcrR family transcriptional regulator n=1 Tax=Brevibacillus fulvus TaxID=1125967 RepID=A0A938Y0I3_9BACL|nr:TetR/AcrR family transcriptional regulator [Brevibacillus fulvus]MBM7591116.1 AcrR family transcriptional regulator [Brevibacillus fulvus]